MHLNPVISVHVRAAFHQGAGGVAVKAQRHRPGHRGFFVYVFGILGVFAAQRDVAHRRQFDLLGNLRVDGDLLPRIHHAAGPQAGDYVVVEHVQRKTDDDTAPGVGVRTADLQHISGAAFKAQCAEDSLPQFEVGGDLALGEEIGERGDAPHPCADHRAVTGFQFRQHLDPGADVRLQRVAARTRSGVRRQIHRLRRHGILVGFRQADVVGIHHGDVVQAAVFQAVDGRIGYGDHRRHLQAMCIARPPAGQIHRHAALGGG